MKLYKPSVTETETVSNLSQVIDSTCGDTIEFFYNSFQALETPVVFYATISKLLNVYEKYYQNNMMLQYFGIN